MRRLLSWTFNGAAVAALVLLVATFALWVLSYRHLAPAKLPTDAGTYDFESRYGSLRLEFDPAPRPLAGVPPANAATNSTSTGFPFPGVAWWEQRTTYRNGNTAWFDLNNRGIRIDYWLVVGVMVLPVALAVWLQHRRRVRLAVRLREARCLSCGYDLRATPGRCPECGMPQTPVTRRKVSN